MIKSIDRLGRNYDETLEQWRVITKEKNVNVVVLDMPILNTYQDGDLTRKLISDIVLQLLSYVAQQEREFIRQRQTEGDCPGKGQGNPFWAAKKAEGRKLSAVPEAVEKGGDFRPVRSGSAGSLP